MVRFAIVVLFSMAVAAQEVERSTSNGKIQGLVTDVTKGGIPAVVKVIRTDTGAVVARLRADRTGAFQTQGLNPGSYAVTAWDQGFRRRDLAGIIVRNGEITDVGGVQLDLAGCDAPSINCDEFFTDTRSRKSSRSLVARGSLRINSGCGADLEDHGKQYCSEPPKSRPSKKIDVLLAHDGNDLYLIAANGATMSMPNSSRADCGGARSAFA